jgi:hypothetical protein
MARGRPSSKSASCAALRPFGAADPLESRGTKADLFPGTAADQGPVGRTAAIAHHRLAICTAGSRTA